MDFSNEQKLIITLLTDIHEALNIQDSVNPRFIQRMVVEEQTWALEWKYPGIFQESEEDKPQIRFVADVLNMWERLEYQVSKFDAAEKAELEQKAGVFGRDVRFRGFDGNNETDEMSITSIFVEDLDRWSDFKGRDFNAHMRLSDAYRRMLGRFAELPYDRELTVDEVASVLYEQTHPENR